MDYKENWEEALYQQDENRNMKMKKKGKNQMLQVMMSSTMTMMKRLILWIEPLKRNLQFIIRNSFQMEKTKKIGS
jgi:hypothetical protein